MQPQGHKKQPHQTDGGRHRPAVSARPQPVRETPSSAGHTRRRSGAWRALRLAGWAWCITRVLTNAHTSTCTLQFECLCAPETCSDYEQYRHEQILSIYHAALTVEQKCHRNLKRQRFRKFSISPGKHLLLSVLLIVVMKGDLYAHANDENTICQCCSCTYIHIHKACVSAYNKHVKSESLSLENTLTMTIPPHGQCIVSAVRLMYCVCVYTCSAGMTLVRPSILVGEQA